MQWQTERTRPRECRGTLHNGTRTDLWLRWTAGLRKIDGVWLIAHDQVSVPVDFASGRALFDLQP